MKKFTIILMLLGTLFLANINIQAQNAWINEIHYDNSDGDVNEFIEIVLEDAASYSLSDFTVTLYNGSNGASYNTHSLDEFTTGATTNNFTVYSLLIPGIQNGAPDGMALDYQGTLITGQFLSYEGDFTATDDPANGITSTDIGVSEGGSTQIGESLQLSGTGSSYSDFVWQAPATETPGAENNNQTLGGGGGNTAPAITNIGLSIEEPNSTQTIAVNADIVDADGTIATATLHWGTTSGNLSNDINMSVSSGDNYVTDTDIPAQTDGTTVYYTIEAIDNEAGTTTSDEKSYNVTDPVIATIPYSQDFETDLGEFDNYSVTGEQIWYQNTYSGNGYAKMSGYQGGNFANEDWLISPIFNLDDYNNEQLTFASAKKYDGNALQLFYSTDFDGLSNPSTNGTWTELTDQAAWSTGDYTWVNSNIIDISGITGTAVYFAFKYTSTDTDGATWQIDNFSIIEEVLVPTITVTAPNGGEQWHQETAYNITWTSENITGNVKIELTGTNSSVIVASTENTGTYSWTIPADQTLASDYKVKISSVDDDTVLDESDATFTVVSPYVPGNIVITEIMYNPPESGTDTLEFIELLNIGDYTINLEGYHFSAGVEFIFPAMDMTAGEYVVVAVNSEAMTNFFGVSSLQWTSGGLSNGGEDIVLRDALETIVDSVDYDDNTPWPTAPDGNGSSLSLCDPSSDNSVGENWSASDEVAGQNGEDAFIFATPGAPCGTCDMIADFDATNTTIGVGETATFIDLTTGTPELYEWIFEGGTPETSNIQNPSDILYNETGTYDVTLIVYNATGSDIIIKEDYITVVAAPVANFSADETTIPADGTVTFSDESTGNPTAWAWTFEGGEPATYNGQTPPAISYADLGSYDVTLTVSNEYGETTEVKTDYITVTDLPIASFTADETAVTEGESVTFSDETTGEPTTWEWIFEGGEPATFSGQTPPAITYNTTGLYDVTLTVSNDLGENSLVREEYIAVGLAPIADFEANNIEILTGQTVTFADLSENNPTAWAWTFEGGSPAISSEQNPEITYTTVGIYNVTLVATNQFGENVTVKYDYITVKGTSIETLSLEKEGVILYPNPTNGSVNIISSAANSQVEIFSTVGKLVYRGTISGTESVIDLNYLPNGIYTVQVTDKNSDFKKVKRLIIK
ncbi:MAG: PKD domain-containing protein [Bacteroidota bacterium]|nr:PKD domain-containing protein [Bacteroidota bacterium]